MDIDKPTILPCAPLASVVVIPMCISGDTLWCYQEIEYVGSCWVLVGEAFQTLVMTSLIQQLASLLGHDIGIIVEQCRDGVDFF